MKLSVVMPVHNEEGCVAETLASLTATLRAAEIEHEIIVVDDNSNDGTSSVAGSAAAKAPAIRVVSNPHRAGFGRAVRYGIDHATGEAVAIMMADGSDSAEDLVLYYRTMLEGYDCVFGSRFIKGGRVVDYPKHKLVLNRLANLFIRVLFGFRYNDITNAFKIYSREVIETAQPLISPHFNLTVEMPLKAIVRGYSYAVVPICWRNRKRGLSKLKIKEMGSRYLFIVLYLWLEKHLARGDYHCHLEGGKNRESV